MTEKFTLINVDSNILQDYTVFAEANPHHWNIVSYLNFKYDMNAALAFSKLFFPDFIEVNGCIILSFLYNETVFQAWLDKFNNDVQQTEKMCNLYKVADYFHINKVESTNFQLLSTFAHALKISWELNCKALFNKNITVEVFESLGDLKITLYQTDVSK